VNALLPLRRQSGLTYIEVMIATALVAIALLPAMDGLYTSMRGSDVVESSSNEHYAALALMEDVLAEPFSMLTAAAAGAGDEVTPSSYSDAGGAPDRRLVFVARYDADNSDGDGDVFTVPDPNLDGDNNPYTGYAGLLWVQVKVEGSVHPFESLTAP
jgi:type II secretory pathway pseudopilin PulG